ncbi:ACS family glucarate transporter-like MFS transporter [Dyadobacter jejuensis]|uniref:ACS family glucarate transporter-like MFS transporter n=1 Tax=Dyadobacter jejuensis TaxID=1082580 RepID=A0A316AGN6_9BACT|nr:MFS transporter [Dyadobacter jejuensis]PWJ56863.1 ACS family glucarate transporter-like MFS transporter [Dyadobacter jejuensis]
MIKIPLRHKLVATTFALTLLLYIDRVCISAAKAPVTESLGLTDTQFGWVLSAFALGYALLQTTSGQLIDRKGPHIVLTTIVTIWSLMTALTAAAWNFGSLLVVRFLFGAGEAGAFPGISKSTLTWIPLKERGLVTGINFSGSRLGAAFAMPLVVWLLNSFGWRESFLILGVVGVAWAVFWYSWFRDAPEQHPSISAEELDYILKNRQVVLTTKQSVSLGSLLRNKQVWWVMLQYFGSNYIFFFCLTWLFPFLKAKYQMDDLQLSYWVMLPFIAGAFGNYFSGYLVDALYKRNGLIGSRRIPAIIGFALIVIGLVANIGAENIYTSIACLSLAIFGADMTLSPSWSYCIDVGGEHAGALSGTMNMAGNLGSFLTALAFPYLQAWTGDENTFFYVGIGLAIIAIYGWTQMNAAQSLKTYE